MSTLAGPVQVESINEIAKVAPWQPGKSPVFGLGKSIGKSSNHPISWKVTSGYTVVHLF